jgi:hypothetical protein
VDAERFDDLTKAMAGGATRRRALRLAGGGLAGALLAAAGLGRRAGAQDDPRCDEFYAECRARAEEACGGPQPSADVAPEAFLAWVACMEEQPACRRALMACPRNCKTGEGACSGCREDQVCAATSNPGNRLVCRCISL